CGTPRGPFSRCELRESSQRPCGAGSAPRAAPSPAYALVAGVALFVAGLTLFSGFGLGTLLMPAFALFLPVPVAVAATAVVHLAQQSLQARAGWSKGQLDGRGALRTAGSCRCDPWRDAPRAPDKRPTAPALFARQRGACGDAGQADGGSAGCPDML